MDLKSTVLGLELGSTRIKAVLLDRSHTPIASGSFAWENKLVDGVWTYDLDDVHAGLQACYADLARDVREKFGQPLTTVGAIGISGMMHGYLVFDRDLHLLVPFRTWRNTITAEAAGILSREFGFNVPQRWSIAHLYQAILNGEDHVGRIGFLATLSSTIPCRLTGLRGAGANAASGMFPLDPGTKDYDQTMLDRFAALIADRNLPWTLPEILPKRLLAGADAGTLTAEGARFLDPTGTLEPGIPLCPPEGDGGTGMIATNSVRPGIGNVSAGTSGFAMVVLDHGLKVHPEIDIFNTPAGHPVAMVHCNNCTSDINGWVALLGQFAALLGVPLDPGQLFPLLFEQALLGAPDCGGLVSYNYLSGEHLTGMNEGRPLFVRRPDAAFTLPNFMRTLLQSALGTMKLGLGILMDEEQVKIDKLYGHGGFFKTPGVGQRILSAAVGTPVSVMETAGEGGPYGMALLAAYRLWKAPGQSLEDYLDHQVFADARVSTILADPAEIQGFRAFMEPYTAGLAAERAAVENL